MALTVRKLELRDFRSYGHCLLSGMGRRMVLIGPNASGKTNVVEALQLCTGISSFRSPRPVQLVRMGTSEGRASVCLSDDARMLEVELVVDGEGKHYQLNGKRRTGSSLKGIMPAVVFTPDDLNLAKGSSSVRRRQLDSLGSQVSTGYRSVLRDYEKLIRQKNRCLKDGATSDYLAAFDELLCRVGSQLFVLRMRLLAELEPYLSEFYSSITGGAGSLSLLYLPSWTKEADVSPEGGAVDWRRWCDSCDRGEASRKLAAALAERREEERIRSRSLVGPHADKVGFLLNGNDASLYASQGQQRSAVLSLKMAELSLIMDRIDQSPLLLLDDVMSELDEGRRRAFMETVPEDVQMVVTTTNRDYFDESFLSSADVVDMDECLVRRGEVGRIDNSLIWRGSVEVGISDEG